MSRVLKQWVCDDCGGVSTASEMTTEFDYSYDQDCCPHCHGVMFDNLHGMSYCKSLDEIRHNLINQILNT